MALVKCKECGNEISKKAKKCPSCGAPQRRTSVVTKLVLLVFIFGVIGSILTSTNKERRHNTALAEIDKQQSASHQKPEQPKKAAPKPSWDTSSQTDKMSGATSHFASSPIAYPTPKMGFPYRDARGWLGVGCKGSSEWVYIGFNDAPNLANTKTESGYSKIRARIKWDDNVETVNLTQDWGARFIHFQVDGPALSKIQAANTALLELQWHGEQPVFFEFSLNGSSKALKEIRKKCGRP